MDIDPHCNDPLLEREKRSCGRREAGGEQAGDLIKQKEGTSGTVGVAMLDVFPRTTFS